MSNKTSLNANQVEQESILNQAKSLLDQDNLVVIPTETVYGLAAKATSDFAVNKIYELKNRPKNNPLICHVANLESLTKWIEPNDINKYLPILKKLSVFWPGPLTVIVPKNPSISQLATAGQNSVGLRIPSHPMTLKLLEMLDYPLCAPSANISNYVSPTSAFHVKKDFGENCPFIIDGGICDTGIESTVLSLLDITNPTILRAGAISKNQLEKCLKQKVNFLDSFFSSNQELLSPGLLSKHYCPKTPMKFLHLVDFTKPLPAKVGLIAFRNDLNLDYDFAAIKVLSNKSNLEEIASNLYSAIRNMDQLDLDLILIDQCEPVGLGVAIMDRLKRACR